MFAPFATQIQKREFFDITMDTLRVTIPLLSGVVGNNQAWVRRQKLLRSGKRSCARSD